jgi:hypothetical protein
MNISVSGLRAKERLNTVPKLGLWTYVWYKMCPHSASVLDKKIETGGI